MGVPHDALALAHASLVSLPTQHQTSESGPQDTPLNPLARAKGNFTAIMTQSSMHTMAFFAFVYVGIEVSLGGSSSSQKRYFVWVNVIDRMDCDIHDPRERWGTIVGLRELRILWRLAALTPSVQADDIRQVLPSEELYSYR